MTRQQTCPLCESPATTTIEKFPYIPLHGPTVHLEELICKCTECEEETVINDAEYAKRNRETIKQADIESIANMVSQLASRGITAAHIEGVFGLSPRTVHQWKTKGYSVASLTLVRLIRTLPWLLEIVERGYKPAEAKKISKYAVNEVLFPDENTAPALVTIDASSGTFVCLASATEVSIYPSSVPESPLEEPVHELPHAHTCKARMLQQQGY